MTLNWNYQDGYVDISMPNYVMNALSTLNHPHLQQPTNSLIVETAAENHPAINLYRRFGFEIVKEWTLDIGILKVQLRKTVKH